MAQEQPIRYGDVFLVSDSIADMLIAPQDAAAMQSAEIQVLGQPQHGGPAAVMASAATRNVLAGLVPPGSASNVGRSLGMSVTDTIIDGHRIITESVGDQVVAQYVDPDPSPKPEKMMAPPSALEGDAVTVGEALEASAISAGNKPINHSDAAAIQAAEMRATGTHKIIPGGIGAAALSAATHNARLRHDDQKTTIGDVLADARTKLPDDKLVDLEDAEKIISAEIRNNPEMATALGGVGESIVAAARINQQKDDHK